MKKIIFGIVFSVFALVLLVVPAMAYTLASTNALNQASNAPGRPGQLAPHVVLTNAGVGQVILTFKNPSVVLACFERKIDGQVAYHNNVQTNHYYPPLAAEGEKVYPFFCMSAGAPDRVETYSANSFVEIRHAFGPENDWYFDWTKFDVLPNPDLDGDGVFNENDQCENTDVDGVWDSGKWGTNRWQVMAGDGDVLGWYQNKPAKKGETVATYKYPMSYTYGCNGHQILTFLKEKLGDVMNGHRKFGLSSSVLEEFHKDLSDGKLDGQYLVETVTVPANKSTDTTSVNPLLNGLQYKLVARGTANAGDSIEFDARYSYRTGSSTEWTDAVSTYESYGTTLLDLLFNGVTPWGVYNAGHEYSYMTTGNGSLASFRIYDEYYPNNTGNIYVDIYAQL